MQISDLLAIPCLHLRFLSGTEHAHRSIRWAHTTDLLEPRRYLHGGELVLTGMVWRSRREDSETFVHSLHQAGAVCLAAGTALGDVPSDLIKACQRYDMPLVEVPPETSFSVVIEEVVRLLTHRRISTIADTRDRYRRMMAEVTTGADFREIFAGAAREAGVRAWVISTTGRSVAATDQNLPDADREWLAAQALGWPGFPCVTHLPGPGGIDGTTVTVFPVQTPTSHPLAGWFLVCTGNHTSWPETTHDAVAEITSIAVLARSRLEERRISDAQHAQDLWRLLAAQRLDAVAALLRSASPPDTASQSYIVLSASLLPEPRLPDLARRTVSELVVGWPGTVVTGEYEGLAVVPVSSVGQADEPAVERLHAQVTRDARGLEAGLDRYRLAVGLGSTVHSIPELHGAVIEARQARRLAEQRGGRSRVTAGTEIDSHELLLATVPEEVRFSYRDRLLGPLLEYDRDHRSDLVRTLERFLAHSGSWQRCAAAMHVHVNTLRYRIGRVEELTGRDLSDLEHRVDLLLALKLRS